MKTNGRIDSENLLEKEAIEKIKAQIELVKWILNLF